MTVILVIRGELHIRLLVIRTSTRACKNVTFSNTEECDPAKVGIENLSSGKSLKRGSFIRFEVRIREFQMTDFTQENKWWLLEVKV